MTYVIYIVKQASDPEGHMRVSREQATENRQKIVEVASRLFREHGFDGIGVDAIMKEAGLTHGGFYGHFGSKDDLAAEAVTAALARGNERMSRFTDLPSYVAAYLSERHYADRAEGCGLAALGADFPREGKGVRRAITSYVAARLDGLAALFKGTAAARRKRAIATLSGLVGALTLARAVDDAALSREILAAAREAFAQA
jgi:TetR/AcrR family transcriptional regulator, transcriptional repressor for nem operon